MTPHQKNYKSLMRTSQKEKHEMAFLLGIRSRGLRTPEREHRFHPERKWRVDFAWPEFRLFVEIEGGIWRRGGGAHSHPLNIERDIEKSNAITMAGFHLLRVTDKTIRSGEAFKLVEEFLARQTQQVVVPRRATQGLVFNASNGELLPCVSTTQ